MDLFPTLPGLSWSVLKAPKFATRIQQAISGRELRVLDQAYPIWTWTLTYEFLRDKNDTHAGLGLGNGYDELRTLAGFFLKQQGQFQTFLYSDPTDNLATNVRLGTGDGVTTTFQLARLMGNFIEPVTQPQVVSGVFVNGTATGYSLGAFGVITISPAPGIGLPITATFTYAWPVRFSADTFDFDNFMYQLWLAKQIKFESVLLP